MRVSESDRRIKFYRPEMSEAAQKILAGMSRKVRAQRGAPEIILDVPPLHKRSSSAAAGIGYNRVMWAEIERRVKEHFREPGENWTMGAAPKKKEATNAKIDRMMAAAAKAKVA
jgi:hypothetical protein